MPPGIPPQATTPRSYPKCHFESVEEFLGGVNGELQISISSVGAFTVCIGFQIRSIGHT